MREEVALCLVSSLQPVRLKWPTRNMKLPASIACKIIETHKPLYHDQVPHTEEHVNNLEYVNVINIYVIEGF